MLDEVHGSLFALGMKRLETVTGFGMGIAICCSLDRPSASGAHRN